MLLVSVSYALVLEPVRGYVDHAPIIINGDADFTEQNGVVGGNGTEESPYLIEGWSFPPVPRPAAIEIQSTRAHFIVKNVSIENLGGAGIRLSNASHGRIDSTFIDGGNPGIELTSVEHFVVWGNRITDTEIRVRGASHLSIEENDLTTGGIVLTECTGPVSVVGNRIDRALWGIRALQVGNATLQRNDIANSTLAAILVEMSNGTLVDRNSIVATNSVGVSVSDSDAVRIVANDVVGGASHAPGISLVRAHRARLEDNNATVDGPGIVVTRSEAVAATGNRIAAGSGEAGLEVHFAPDILLANNVITSNTWGQGIGIWSTERATILSNRVGQNKGAGTLLQESDFAIVRGNTIDDNGLGLWLIDSRSATVEGNVFENDAIRLDGVSRDAFASHTIARDNLVNGREVFYEKDCGDLRLERVSFGQILVANCRSLEVTNSTLVGGEIGIEAAWVGHVVVRATTLSDLWLGVLLKEVTRSEFRENTVLRSVFAGIEVQGAGWGGIGENSNEDVLVADNEIHGNLVGVSTRARVVSVLRNNISANRFGGHVVGSVRVRLEGNILENPGPFGQGFGIYDSGNVSVLGNRVQGGTNGGLEIFRVTNLTIEGNSISAGIYAEVANATIRWNVISSSLNPTFGLIRSRNVLIEGNDIVGPRQGVSLWDVNNVTLVRNSISSTSSNALCATAPVAEVVFYHNNVTSPMGPCSNGVSGLVWDHGYPDGGNYWSSYSGHDNCSGPAQDVCPDPDGIGDVPFPATGTNADRYPLTAPMSDRIAPSLYIVRPSPGQALDPDVVVSGMAVDTGGSGLTRIEVRINGGPWSIASGSAPWSLAVTLDPGPNLVEARAFDGAGNPSITRSVAVRVGPPNVAPTAAFTISSTQGDITTVFVFDASTSTDPEDSPSELVVRWDWEADGQWDTPWSSSKVAQHQFATPGEYRVRLEAMDSEGLTHAMERSVHVVLDSTPPVLQHMPPASARVGSRIRILVNATDASAVSITLHYAFAPIGGSPGSFASVAMEVRGEGSYEASIPATESPGFVEYYFVADDASGNNVRYPATGAFRIEIGPESTPSGVGTAGLEPLVLIGVLVPLVGVVVAIAALRRRRRRSS